MIQRRRNFPRLFSLVGVELRGQVPEASVKFDEESFCGITCRRHGRYGMVLLVKVGDPEGAEDLKEKTAGMRGSDAKKNALTTLVDRHLSN